MRNKLLLLMGLLGVLPLTARDFEYTYKGQTLTYTVLDETAKTVETKAGEYNEGGTSTGFPIIITLSNYVPGNDVSGDIIIPSTVYDGDEAFTVVSIGDYAFAKGVPGPEYLGCQITTISLPESVTSIGKEAFAQCAMLSSITFPESLASIGDYAFVNSGLTSITLSESLVSIGYGGFASCKSLKSAELPDGLSEIADFLFGGCTALESVHIPAQAKRIGEYAFNNCTSLAEVNIPEGVTELGASVFESCNSLTSIVIPDGVTTIPESAFKYCTALTSVVIPQSVTSIEKGAFAGDLSSGIVPLTDIKLPNKLESIGGVAFSYCIGLHSIEIPASVKTIGDGAFFSCYSLSNIEIPASVKTIGDGAFFSSGRDVVMTIADGVDELSIGSYALSFISCKSMHIGRPLSAESYNDNFNFGTTQELSIGNTLTEIPDGAFTNHWGLKELTLGGGLERIGANAFSGCGLTEVVIPPSVSSIGEMAFANNADLTEVKIGHGITEIGEKAFDGCNNLANIYIAAQTPPSAPNNTFSSFNAPLWLTDEDSFEAYSNSPVCWHSFEDNLLAMKPVEELTTDNPLIEGNPGDKLHLTVNVEPADATLPHIFWSSSDPSVATVDNDGNVTFTAEAAAAVAGQDDTEEEMLYDTVRSCVIRAQSMYAGVPVLELAVNKSIPEEDPAVEIQTVEADADAPMEIYTLRGIRVGSDLDTLPHGIYIIRQGAKTTKRAI